MAGSSERPSGAFKRAREEEEEEDDEDDEEEEEKRAPPVRHCHSDLHWAPTTGRWEII